MNPIRLGFSDKGGGGVNLTYVDQPYNVETIKFLHNRYLLLIVERLSPSFTERKHVGMNRNHGKESTTSATSIVVSC